MQHLLSLLTHPTGFLRNLALLSPLLPARLEMRMALRLRRQRCLMRPLVQQLHPPPDPLLPLLLCCGRAPLMTCWEGTMLWVFVTPLRATSSSKLASRQG